MRTCPAGRADAPRARDGVSLLELLVVLAIMGLALALLMPSGSRLLDQTTAHAVFFELQRELSAIRRDASRAGRAVTLEGTRPPLHHEAKPLYDERATAPRESIALPSPWTYSLEPDLVVSEGGACSPADLRLYRDDEEVMRLRVTDAACGLTRLR